MQIIECIPLTKGLGKESLTYFTSKVVSVGQIVSVEIRAKKVPALVVNTRPLPEEKIALKSATFSLKKVLGIRSDSLYFSEAIAAAEDAARYYIGNTGSILSHYTLSSLLESGSGTKTHELNKGDIHEIHLLQGNDEERLLEYRGLIREYFAKGKSVVLIAPIIEYANNLYEELSRGIEDYTYLFHNNIPKKNIENNFKDAISKKHPILIVGTAPALTIPRHDIGLFIIEREGSRYYKSQLRPYPDARHFAKMIARRYYATLVYGDSALRIETLYDQDQSESGAYPTSKMRISGIGESKIVDMKKGVSGEEKEFSVLGDEVKEILTRAKESNEKVFLFASRRGLSPITLCRNCGTLVKCEKCSSPMVLHKGTNANHFLCHHCGERSESLLSCKTCGGWDLKDFGIGISKIAEILEKEFKETPYTILSSDEAPTAKKASEIAKRFYATNGAVLIGTEYAIPYLNKKIDHCIVISIDSLFALPDFKISEKIFGLLLNLRGLSRHGVVIQTRATDKTVFENAVRGDIISFYKNELEMRQIFNWPPFSRIFKISVEGKKDQVAAEMKKVVEDLPRYEVEVFPAFVPSKNKLFGLHAIIRRDRHDSFDHHLHNYLKNLPPQFSIEVDPESIL